MKMLIATLLVTGVFFIANTLHNIYWKGLMQGACMALIVIFILVILKV